MNAIFDIERFFKVFVYDLNHIRRTYGITFLILCLVPFIYGFFYGFFPFILGHDWKIPDLGSRGFIFAVTGIVLIMSFETDKEEREVAELLYGADTLYDLEQQERQLSLESELTSAAHGQDGAADPTSNIGVPQTEGLLFDVPSRPIGEEKPVVAEDREELPTPLIIKPSAENQPEETEVTFELEEPTVAAKYEMADAALTGAGYR